MFGSRLTVVLFALTLLGCLFLRVEGIGFAPTSPRARPDEEIFIQRGFEEMVEPQGEAILESGWPEGFFRIQHALMRAEASAIRWAWGRPVNMGCLYVLNPGAVELPTRLFSALCDLITCLLLGLTLVQLVPSTERPWAMAIGLVAYGSNYLAVRDAHFGVSDATVVLCMSLCLYFALRAALERPAWLIGAGIAAGAGIAVKYSAAVLIVPCAVAAVVAFQRFPARGRTVGFCLLAFLAAVMTVAAVSPETLNVHELTHSLLRHRFRYDEAVRDRSMDSSWIPEPWWRFYLLEDLPAAFGFPGLLLATCGLLVIAVTSPAAGAILIGSTLGTLATLVGSQLLFARYAAPLVPPLVVGLGFILEFARERLLARSSRWVAWPAFAVVLVSALGPPLWASMQFDRLLARPATYDVASRWLLSKGPDVRVVTQGWYAQVQLLDPLSEKACAAEVPSWLNPGVPQMPEVGTKWPVAIEAGEIGWPFIASEGMNKYVFDLDDWEHADYVAVGRILLPCGKEAGPLQEHLPLDDGCFETVGTISPGSPSCDSRMDPFDYFPAPFSGFKGWERIGPRIELLKNLCKPAPITAASGDRQGS